MMKWPDNKRIAVMMAFDLDAETMWTTRGDGNGDHITNLSRGVYGPKQGVPRILDMLDVHQIKASFFVPGVIIACFGALVLVSNGGAFDIFAYGAHIFFSLFKRDVTARKYRTFYDYRQSRAEKKRSVAFMLVVGLAMVAVAAVFLIAYYAMQQPA